MTEWDEYVDQASQKIRSKEPVIVLANIKPTIKNAKWRHMDIFLGLGK